MHPMLRGIMGAAGGGGYTPSPYRYWRFHVISKPTGLVGFAEVEFLGSIGGTDLTGTAGGASFSSTANGSFPPANAFDDASGTLWISSNAAPQYIGWDFGASNEQSPVSVTVTIPASSSYGFTDAAVEASNGGGIYDTIIEITGESGWVSGEKRTYNFEDYL